jgi:two-component system CheB/CheR fusion protein
VVGLGASAGGLSALQHFFAATISEQGLAYVVVQHLSPDFKSLMAELLARHTDMPIFAVEEGMQLQPNSVYLIPPQTHLTVQEEGRFHLEGVAAQVRPESPIDVFFDSLAQVYGSKSAAIVLSGTGTDGSHGVLAINSQGGLVLVQNEASAEFSGMPNQAIKTRVSDFVVPPQEMPGLLKEWVSGTKRVAEAELVSGQDPMQSVMRLLENQCGVDFSSYKPATILRRIERRMRLSEAASFADYLEFAEGNKEELESLRDDLLIGVTSFFRDEKAFKHLKEYLQETVRKAASDKTVFRVWIAACSTGEEVYTVAMILDQILLELGSMMSVRIFATDLDQASLSIASAGVYRQEDIEKVPEDMRQKYFTVQKHGGVRVAARLREQVVFAQHNLLTDPPFLDLDLVTCRNLLIYLDGNIQTCVLSFFLYSLNMDGLLLLGASEGIGSYSEYFATLDGKWKIYRKVRNAGPPLRASSLRLGPHTSEVAPIESSTRGKVTRDRQLIHDYEAIIEKCGVSAVLLDERRRPLHVLGDAHRYLQVRTGRFEDDILNMVGDDLRINLSVALQKLDKTSVPVSIHAVPVHYGDQEIEISLEASLIANSDSGVEHYFVLFSEEKPRQQVLDDLNDQLPPGDERYRQRVLELERELRLTKESLQATVEELQTANEELQSTNEELQAANEELQSSNEELHSVNEELYSVNSEYEVKNRELFDLNEDHENLLNSLDIGTIFLNHECQIRKFNPAIDKFFKLIPQDIGRPLSHIAYTLGDLQELLDDVQAVLDGGGPLEREVVSDDGTGAWSLVRVLPYLNGDQSIDGVVVTFTDVNRLKHAEIAAAAERDRAESANKAKVRFLATVSHELRTPLNGVIGSLDILAETDMRPDQQELLHTADACGRHLSVLINDILDYTALEERHRIIALHDQVFDPFEVIDNATMMVADRAWQKGLELDAIVDGNVPHAIRGDQSRLTQVISNLLANAVKYTEKGFIRLHAYYSQQGDGDGEEELLIEVRDSGVGIAAGDIEHVFTPFTQVGTEGDGHGQGVGLGLALCQQIVHAMNGTIRVQSEVGKGTTFSVALPVHQSDESALEPAVPVFTGAAALCGPSLRGCGLPELLQASGLQVQFFPTFEHLVLAVAEKQTVQPALLVISHQLIHDASDWQVYHDQLRAWSLPEHRLMAVVPQGTQQTWRTLGVDALLVRPLRYKQVQRQLVQAFSDDTFASQARASQPSRPVDVSVDPRRILVVEDNPINQQIIRRQLESCGHEVVVANNGSLGLTALQDQVFDGVFMDLMMPVMDGYTATTQIRRNRAHWADIPVIALTASCYPEDIQRCTDAGFTNVLHKPIRKSELQKIIEEYFTARAEHR